ncbi:MAG: hypothetical protein IJH07_07095 [Ruminococcus sp.]|nr:hypothetical protein [Ruminococcus sp.]
MKQHRWINNLISLLLTLCVVCAVGAVTAFAEPFDEQLQEQQEAPQDETPQDEMPRDETPQDDFPQDETPQDQEEQPEPPQEPEPQDNEWYDYIYSYDENAVSSYVEPEHLGELPEVSSQQVVEATAVPMPTVAVSDASLFSGIVMWLCVALGIAVVVGVLVSKRTRRRGV